MAEIKDIEDEAAATVENVNPRDAVNDDVRAAIASLTAEGEPLPEAGAAPEQHAPAADTSVVKADHPTDPNRYLDGTFKSKAAPAKDAAPAKAAAPDPKLPPPEDPAKVSAQPSTAGAPPTSWAADAKAAWATASPAIQAAALKREQEVSAGFRQYSETTKAYERLFAPLEQESQRRGLSAADGLQRLLDGETFFRTQPAQAILWLAQQHGLNLAELASNPPAPQPAARSEAVVPPQVLEQVSSLQEQLNGLVRDRNLGAVEQFAEKNPHYATVEEQLPDLMRELKLANPALTGVPLLQAAYDRAIWLNPDVRARMISEQTAQTQQAVTQRVAAKAAQASRAAISVKGSSADTRPPPKPNGVAGAHVTDDVRAAIEQLRAN